MAAGELGEGQQGRLHRGRGQQCRPPTGSARSGAPRPRHLRETFRSRPPATAHRLRQAFMECVTDTSPQPDVRTTYSMSPEQREEQLRIPRSVPPPTGSADSVSTQEACRVPDRLSDRAIGGMCGHPDQRRLSNTPASALAATRYRALNPRRARSAVIRIFVGRRNHPATAGLAIRIPQVGKRELVACTRLIQHHFGSRRTRP